MFHQWRSKLDNLLQTAIIQFYLYWLTAGLVDL